MRSPGLSGFLSAVTHAIVGEQQHGEERSHEDGSRDWSNVATSQGMLRDIRSRKRRVSLRPFGVCGGVVLLPWFSNSGLQSRENNTFLLF